MGVRIGYVACDVAYSLNACLLTVGYFHSEG